MSAFPPLSEGVFLAVIKNLTVVGFNDFSVAIVDQHICTAHIGPVRSRIGRRQVTQLPLLNVVLIGAVHLWYSIAGFEMLEVSNETA